MNEVIPTRDPIIPGLGLISVLVCCKQFNKPIIFPS